MNGLLFVRHANRLKKMIQTFIFFDLETTGLITGSLMPKITELSMIAVSRDALCNSKETLPRVLHKVVLPIYPNRSIPKPVQLKTDLCNENLEDVLPFDCEVYDIVVNFLKRLAMPACFVAYNGNVFDYPIFLWELRNINKGLDTNVLSIDMLYLIKDFFSDKGKAMEQFQGKGQDARRRLDFTSGRPPNFKLTSVHEHILGAAPEHAHTAEGDCLSMLRCASQLGNFFVEWADCNAVPLHTREKKC